MLLNPFGKLARLFTEAVEREMREVIRRQNLRAFRVQATVADAHFVDAIHQLGHEIKAEARVAKRLDALLRRENYARVFDGVIEIVLAKHWRRKISARAVQANLIHEPLRERHPASETECPAGDFKAGRRLFAFPFV